MGRRRIKIQRIEADRGRATTFVKRRAGLFKKAYELAELCGATITVLITDEQGHQSAFSSRDDNYPMCLRMYQNVTDIKYGKQFRENYSDESDESEQSQQSPRSNPAKVDDHSSAQLSVPSTIPKIPETAIQFKALQKMVPKADAESAMHSDTQLIQELIKIKNRPQLHVDIPTVPQEVPALQTGQSGQGEYIIDQGVLDLMNSPLFQLAQTPLNMKFQQTFQKKE